MDVFALLGAKPLFARAGLNLVAPRHSEAFECSKGAYRLRPGLACARDVYSGTSYAAARSVLAESTDFRGASEPSQAPERSPQRRLGPLRGRFKFKTRFAGA